MRFLNKTEKLNNKNKKKNQKRKIPHTSFERRTLCFSSFKNGKVKIKLCSVGACKRKKST